MSKLSAAERVANVGELRMKILELAISSYRNRRHLQPVEVDIDGRLVPFEKRRWRYEDVVGDWLPSLQSWLASCARLNKAWRRDVEHLRWQHLELPLLVSSSDGALLGKLMCFPSITKRIRRLVVPSEDRSGLQLEGVQAERAVEGAIMRDRLRFLSAACTGLAALSIDSEWSTSAFETHLLLQRPAAWTGVPRFSDTLRLLDIGHVIERNLWPMLRCMPSLQTLRIRAFDIDTAGDQLVERGGPGQWPQLHLFDCTALATQNSDFEEWMAYSECLIFIFNHMSSALRSMRQENVHPDALLVALGGRSMPASESLQIGSSRRRALESPLEDLQTINGNAAWHSMPHPPPKFSWRGDFDCCYDLLQWVELCQKAPVVHQLELGLPLCMSGGERRWLAEWLLPRLEDLADQPVKILRNGTPVGQWCSATYWAALLSVQTFSR